MGFQSPSAQYLQRLKLQKKSFHSKRCSTEFGSGLVPLENSAMLTAILLSFTGLWCASVNCSERFSSGKGTLLGGEGICYTMYSSIQEGSVVGPGELPATLALRIV